MASSYSTFIAPSLPMKIVPYVPEAPKPRRNPNSKAKPTPTTKTAEHDRPGVGSEDDGEWFHIDNFPMPGLTTSCSLDPGVSALSSAADASSSLDYDAVCGLSAASDSEKPECYQSARELPAGRTGYATSVAKMNSALHGLFDRSSPEFPLVVESNAAEVHHSTTQFKPSNGDSGIEGYRARQDGYLDAASMRGLSVEGMEGICHEPLPIEPEPLLDVGVRNRSPSIRKQTSRLSGDTIVSLEEVLDIASEPELETHLAKRQRLSEEQAGGFIPYHVPTPKPTLLPTPNSPGSSSIASNDSQGGPVMPPSDLDEDDNDDGAYAREAVGERNRKGSDNQAVGTHDLYQVEKVSRRPQAKRFQRSINRPVQEEHRPVTRNQRTMPPRKSQNVTSSQLRQLSRPSSSSANQFCSPQTAFPKMKAGRKTNALGPSANRAYQITDLTHCHVLEGLSILTVILRSKSNLSLDPTVLEHEILSGKGKVIRVTQLSPDSWMLLGYRHDDSGSSTSTRESRTMDTTDWMSSPYSNGASHETNHSNEDDEDEEYKEDLGKPNIYAAKRNLRCRQRTHEPWQESDEVRLLSYRDKMDMEWKDICERFPDRSAGAVKLRYYTLHKKHS